MTKAGVIIGSIVAAATIGGSAAYARFLNEQQWAKECDGTQVTANCTSNGKRYKKYVYHKAMPEEVGSIFHPAVPAKTHTVHHEPVYDTISVYDGCIETNISYKRGTCALSQCWDGTYSGSTGWGTCNYHGGVMRSGGPWAKYREETVMILPAWDEVVVDIPAKEAWMERVIIKPAVAAYYEKEEL